MDKFNPTKATIEAYIRSVYANYDYKDISICPQCHREDCKRYSKLKLKLLSKDNFKKKWIQNCSQFSTNMPQILTEEKRITNILNHMEVQEGNISHLYKDTRGLITIGIGTNLDSMNLKEVYQLPFKIGNRLASRDEIQQELNRIKAMPKGMTADKYKNGSNGLFLSENAITQLAQNHIIADRNNLRKIYKNFDSFSPNLQSALQDMIYSLGYNGLKKFNKFNHAINTWDFETAAHESSRKGVGAERNTLIRNNILKEYEILKEIQNQR